MPQKRLSKCLKLFVMVFLVLPFLFVLCNTITTTVYAADAPWTGATGSGTEEDPYLIKNDSDFGLFSQSTTDSKLYTGKYVKLADDFVNSTAITTAVSGDFRGVFDGNNKTLNLNLTQTGLFNLLYDDQTYVKNLNITGTIDCDNYYLQIGVIANRNDGTIDNCSVNITMTNCGDMSGGITGWNTGLITNCSANVNLTGKGRTGGICGYLDNNGKSNLGFIKNCYVTGSITTEGEGAGVCAGITGSYSSGSIINSYTTVTLSTPSTVNKGAFIGKDWGNTPTFVNAYCLDKYDNTYGTQLSSSQMKGAKSATDSSWTSVTVTNGKNYSSEGAKASLVDLLNDYVTSDSGTGLRKWGVNSTNNGYPVFVDDSNIIYETNGGSSVTSVTSEEIAFPSTDPTKEGCVFEGWYTDSTLETKAVEGTPITTDTTLYAKWSYLYKKGETVDYRLIYNELDGSFYADYNTSDCKFSNKVNFEEEMYTVEDKDKDNKYETITFNDFSFKSSMLSNNFWYNGIVEFKYCSVNVNIIIPDGTTSTIINNNPSYKDENIHLLGTGMNADINISGGGVLNLEGYFGICCGRLFINGTTININTEGRPLTTNKCSISMDSATLNTNGEGQIYFVDFSLINNSKATFVFGNSEVSMLRIVNIDNNVVVRGSIDKDGTPTSTGLVHESKQPYGFKIGASYCKKVELSGCDITHDVKTSEPYMTTNYEGTATYQWYKNPTVTEVNLSKFTEFDGIPTVYVGSGSISLPPQSDNSGKYDSESKKICCENNQIKLNFKDFAIGSVIIVTFENANDLQVNSKKCDLVNNTYTFIIGNDNVYKEFNCSNDDFKISKIECKTATKDVTQTTNELKVKNLLSSGIYYCVASFENASLVSSEIEVFEISVKASDIDYDKKAYAIKNTKITLPSPTRFGYILVGWNESATATTGITSIDSVTGDVTLYAIWKEVIVKEPCKDNDYTVVVDNSLANDITYQWKKNVLNAVKPLSEYHDNTDPETAEYSVVRGYYDKSTQSITVGKENTTDTESMIFLAFVKGVLTNAQLRFKYTGDISDFIYYSVTMVKINDYYYMSFREYQSMYDVIILKTNKENITITDVAIITEGIEDLSGETNAKLGTTTLESTSYFCEVSKDGVVIARTNKITPKKIKFAIDSTVSGEAPETIYQLDGRKITIPDANCYKLNYILSGWHSGASDYFIGDNHIVGDSNIEFTPTWTKSITVQPEQSNEYTVTVNSKLTGVTYQWYKHIDGIADEALTGEINAKLGTTTLENAQYYCNVFVNNVLRATSNSIKPYEIKFIRGLGTGTQMSSMYQLVGRTIVVPECTYTMNNQFFTNWQDWNKGSENHNPGDIYTVRYNSSNTNTLSAIFSDIITAQPSKDNDYQVGIDSRLTNATYQWYKFITTGQTELLEGQTSAKIGEVVSNSYYCIISLPGGLTAQTESIYSREVVLDANGASIDTVSKYSLFGRSITLPTDYERANYVLDGWATTTDSAEGFKETYTLTEEAFGSNGYITLYAVWKAVPHSCGEINYDKVIDSNIDTYTTLQSGNYYLAKDITISATVTIASGSEVNICLNGHSITLIASFSIGSNTPYFKVNGSLNLYDCDDTEHGWVANSTGLWEKVADGVTPTYKTKGGYITSSTALVSYPIYVDGGILSTNNIDFVGVEVAGMYNVINAKGNSPMKFVSTTLQGCISGNSLIYLNAKDSIFDSVKIKHNKCWSALYIANDIVVKDNVIIKENYNGNKTIGLILVQNSESGCPLINLKDNISGTEIDIAVYKGNYDNGVNVTLLPKYLINSNENADVTDIFTLTTYDSNGYYSTADNKYELYTEQSDGKYNLYIGRWYSVTYINYETVCEKTLGAEKCIDNTHYHYGDKVTIKDITGIKLQSCINGKWLDATSRIIGWEKFDGTFAENPGSIVPNAVATITSDMTFKPAWIYLNLNYNVADGKFYYKESYDYNIGTVYSHEATEVAGMYTSEKDKNDRYTIITFNNFNYNFIGVSSAITFKGEDDDIFTITLKGTNSITSLYYSTLYIDEAFTVKGDGTLNLNGSLIAYCNVFIKENVKINITEGQTERNFVVRTYYLNVEDNAVLTIINTAEEQNTFKIERFKNCVVYGKVNLDGEYEILDDFDMENDDYISKVTKDGVTINYLYIRIEEYKVTPPSKDNSFEVITNTPSKYQWYEEKIDETKITQANFNEIVYAFECGSVDEDTLYVTPTEMYGGHYAVAIYVSSFYPYMTFKSATNIDIESELQLMYQNYGVFVTKSYDDATNLYTYKCTFLEDGLYATILLAPEGTVFTEMAVGSDCKILEGETNSTYTPTKSGKYFVTASASFGTFKSETLTASMVKFDANGGAGTIADIFRFSGTEIELPTELTKKGYRLVGYNTDKNATTGITSYEFTDEDVTLYAIWSEKDEVSITETPQNVTYNGNAISFEIKGTTLTGFKVEYYINDAWTEEAPTNVGSYNVKITRKEDSSNLVYEKTITNGLVITKANASITVDTTTITKTYGETITLPEATTNIGTVTCDKTSADLVNAGTYTVTYTVEGNDNYNGDTKTLTVKINKILVTKPTADTTSFTYDGNEKTYALATNALYTITGTLTATNAGTNNISVALNDKTNYEWDDNTASDLSFTFTIAKANASITVDTTTITKTYGETITLPEATTNIGTVTCDKTSADLVNAGTYTVTYTVEGNDNYNGDTKTLTVKINKILVTKPTADTTSFTYDGNEKTYALATNTLYTITGTLTATNAGTNNIIVALNDKTNYEWDDNTASDLSFTFTIAKVKVASTLAVSGTYTYNGSEQTVVVTGVEAYMSTASTLKGTNAGTYTIVYTLDGNHEWAEGSNGTITWTIEKAKAVISVNTATIKVAEGSKVTLPSATSTFGKVTCNKTASDFVGVGTYTVKYTVAGNENYDGDEKTLSVVVMAKEVERKDTDSGTNVVIDNQTGIDPDKNITVTVEVKVEAEITQTEVEGFTNESVKLEGNEKVSVVFDVKLLIDGQEKQPSDLGNGTSLTIKMRIPEEIDVTKVTKILHVHSQNDIEVIEFDINNYDEATRTYTLNGITKLSNFAFVYTVNTLSVGAIVAIIVCSILLLLITIYLLGYFFLYREGLLDDKAIKVIYKFLPRGDYNRIDDDSNNNVVQNS